MQELIDEHGKDNIMNDDDVVQFNESDLKGFMNRHHDELIKSRDFCGAKEDVANGTQLFYLAEKSVFTIKYSECICW